MQTLNQLIAESVEKKDLKTLEQVEGEIAQVIEFTRTRVVHLELMKQATINLILVQKWINRILNG